MQRYVEVGRGMRESPFLNFVRSKTVAFVLRIRVLILYLIDHDLLGSAKQCPVWSVSSVANSKR